ncbi:hypothetical protein RRG08_052525 [Elysia crispata]|uniref:C-type lectin domain-containing protein n=1 Tax=Elysia crispata TaxID=231223 RepID=A0AAE0Y7B8_9GAST|nr:hypothetical protein RRG08_052525 [Elysia crispata]
MAALFKWLVFFLNVLTVRCQERGVYLKQTTAQECQTLQIGESWLSPSALECYMKCTFLYQDTCQSVVYNTDNQMCKPGSVAFGPLENVDTSIPVTGSNDMIFYMKQPIPPCDTNDLAVEDTFVWENGEPLTNEMAQWIWRSGHPDSWGDEDCAEAKHVEWAGLYGLNDASCDASNFYICEPFGHP